MRPTELISVDDRARNATRATHKELMATFFGSLSVDQTLGGELHILFIHSTRSAGIERPRQVRAVSVEIIQAFIVRI
jgi:hypothetical protein